MIEKLNFINLLQIFIFNGSGICCATFVKQTMAMHPHYKVLLNGKVSFVWRIDH